MTPISCAEFVELVTDYLEGALDRDTEGRFVEHVTRCAGCERYLDQFRETIRAVGRLDVEAIDPETCNRLLAVFQDWRASDA
jgi:hypothetical protein